MLLGIILIIAIRIISCYKTGDLYLDYYVDGFVQRITFAGVIILLSFAVKQTFFYYFLIFYSYIQLANCVTYLGYWSDIDFFHSVAYFIVLLVYVLLFRLYLWITEFYDGWWESLEQIK